MHILWTFFIFTLWSPSMFQRFAFANSPNICLTNIFSNRNQVKSCSYHLLLRVKFKVSSSVCWFFLVLLFLWTIWVNIEEKPPLENFGKTAIRQNQTIFTPKLLHNNKSMLPHICMLLGLPFYFFSVELISKLNQTC